MRKAIGAEWMWKHVLLAYPRRAFRQRTWKLFRGYKPGRPADLIELEP